MLIKYQVLLILKIIKGASRGANFPFRIWVPFHFKFVNSLLFEIEKLNLVNFPISRKLIRKASEELLVATKPIFFIGEILKNIFKIYIFVNNLISEKI